MSNPLKILGVYFFEFTSPSPKNLEQVFSSYGFKVCSESAGIKRYGQGDIHIVLNNRENDFAAEFQKIHGDSICGTGFVFEDAAWAHAEALMRGARAFEGNGFLKVPTIYGIGESLIYFLDKFSIAEMNKNLPPHSTPYFGFGLKLADHFTNNVPRGEMKKWSDFYTDIFGFKEIKYFDIKGAKTGLLSKAMQSPCKTFAVPINEPSDDKSQIQEYLEEYQGSGIQHVAFTTTDILETIKALKKNGAQFLTPPPDTYYKAVKNRVPNLTEDLTALSEQAILIDGDEHGYLLQIFTKNICGPIFFEVIQRKEHDGFGEGNFQALFDAIERDQTERGYL